MPKPTLEEYPAWARESIGFDPTDQQFRRRYNLNTNNFRSAVESSEAWSSVTSTFNELAKQYRSLHGVELFNRSNWTPELHVKPFESVVEKTYRVNVVGNKDFPTPPIEDVESGQRVWLTENNLFRRMDDLIRCRIICRYMDGPKFICDSAKEMIGVNVVNRIHSMETDLGYYAWHLSLFIPVTVFEPTGTITDEKLQFEMQITTQLNDVLNDLTHSFYEEKRISAGGQSSLWKWKPDEAQFKGAYFGHTLHLLEGMIVELKNEMARLRREKNG